MAEHFEDIAAKEADLHRSHQQILSTKYESF